MTPTLLTDYATVVEPTNLQEINAGAEITHLRELNHMLVMLLSHELGTPLTHVLAYLRLRQERAGLSERLELDLAVEQAMKLKSRLDDLLLLNQLEVGSWELNRTVLPIQEVIARVVDSQRWNAKEKNVELRTLIESTLPVYGDREMLFRALDHVVGNACKFSRPNSRVDIHAESLGPVCRITVADQGIGIAPEKQAQIFEPFYQVDLTRARRYNGLGIGLKLVRAIVEKHDGLVYVTSQIGCGSTFGITIPLA